MSLLRRSVPLLLAAVALVVAACSSGGGVSSDGACAEAPITLSSAEVHPGDTVEVRISDLWSGCADGPGQERGLALQDQPVVWIQGGEETELARLDTGPKTAAGQASITVPAQAEPGAAVVRVGTTSTADITVTAAG